jgi:hypothetical protein
MILSTVLYECETWYLILVLRETPTPNMCNTFVFNSFNSSFKNYG